MDKGVFRSRFSLVWIVAALFVIISVITRTALLVGTRNSGVSFMQGINSFVIGLLFDLTVASFVILPFVLQLWLQNDLIYRKKIFPFACLFFVGLIAMLVFTSIVPRDFSPELHAALIGYVVFRFAVYLLLY